MAGKKRSETEVKAKPSKKTVRSGGINLKARRVRAGGDIVGRDKLVAGDDIIQTQQYVERQTNITLPRMVQIAIGVAATAIAVIAIAFLRPSQPVLANGEFDSLDGWKVEGDVQLVEVTGETSSIRKIQAAQLGLDAALEQRVDMPDKPPEKSLVLTLVYRVPPGAAAQGTLIVKINDRVVCPIPVRASARDGDTASCDVSLYAGEEQAVLRIEYRTSSARTPGLLAHALVQTTDVVWLDRVAIDEEDSSRITQATLAPSATTLPTATRTAQSTNEPRASATPSPTPKPSVTLAEPTKSAQPPTSPTAQSRAVTVEPLRFTWSTGDFREWGINEAGQGVWAQMIFIEPTGGAPPYTVLFNQQQQAELTFEVFGLFCEGQRGELIVQSADGQSSSEVITVKDPICPTHTPTPTSTATHTSTATETHTPTATHTPTFTPMPQPALVNPGFEDPAIASESVQYVTSIPGWALSFGSTIEINNHNSFFGLIAVQGAQLVELDSTGSSGIYQDIATVPGVSYRVTFAFAARPNTGAGDNVVEVRWDNQSIALVSADGTGQSSAQWKYYTYDVVATSGTSRLEFRDVGIPNSQGTLLDDVSITLVP